MLLAILWSKTTYSETIQVAVASNFYKPLVAISEKFSKISGHSVNLSQGSSGKLYTQIKQGAPFELFLSADQERPERLEADGLIVDKSRYTYAVGQLVLVGRFITNANQDCLLALQQDNFRRIAIANPKLAPYGFAAQQTLDKVTKVPVVDKLVMGSNIAQALNFMITGNVDLAMVAFSQLNANIKQQITCQWLIPEHYYTAINQQIVLLQKGANSNAAKDLWAFIKSPQITPLIEEFGYKVIPQKNTQH